MAKEGTFQLLGQPNPDVADVNKGRIFWNTITDTFQQIDENGVIKDLTSENPAGNNTNIQFNNFGALGGSDNFIFDGTAVGIGTLTPDASALLDLTSTVRGFLMPQMTTIQRDAIPTPATGLEIFNTTTNEPEFFNGSIWLNTGGTAAGGSDTQIQFNDNGAFAGATQLVTDGLNLDFLSTGRARFGSIQELQIHHTGANAIVATTVGDLELVVRSAGDDLLLQNESITNDILIRLGSSSNATNFKVQSGLTDLFVIGADGLASLGVNTSPIPSALLHLQSITEGFLMPVMTTTQRDAIPTPATGLEIYNITTNEPEFFNGSIWLNTGATAPGGADTQIQFNNNGTFDGIFGVTTDGTNINVIDSGKITFGNGEDLKIEHTGSDSLIQNITGNLIIINQGAALGDIVIENFSGTNDIINRLGSASVNTKFIVKNSLNAEVFSIDGDGDVKIDDGPLTINGQLSLNHSGGSTNITSTTGAFTIDQAATASLIIENLSTSNDILMRLGNFNNTTNFKIQDGGIDDIFVVQGDARTSIGINSSPDASALLTLDSTIAGFLMTRMTTTQRDAIPSPATGLEIYNTTTNEPEFFDGSAWITTGGTAPGGANTQVQFNNNGAFDGISGVTTDGAQLDFANGARARFGSGQDLTIEHLGDSTIINNTGEFQIIQTVETSDVLLRLGGLVGATAFKIQDAGLTEIVRIQDDGNVGLGISPISRLHVFENTAATDATNGITIEQDGLGDAALQFLLTAGQRWSMGIDNSDSDFFKISESDDLGTNGRIKIRPGGNTIIGDATFPESKLHVANGTVSGSANTRTVITAESSSDAWISILSPDNREAAVVFGGPISNNHGGIFYNDDQFVANGFMFRTNDTNNRLSITSTGAIGIATNSPDASSLLQVDSTTRGFAMPRMTTTQRDAIPTPITGLEIYNLTTNEPEFFNGSIWLNTGQTAPGGADTQIQFNDNGTFNGNADFIFNGSNFVFDNESIKLTDSSGIHFGPILAPDLVISHGGLDGTIVNVTGSFVFENQDINDDIIFEVGSITNNTSIRFKNSASTDLLVINGDGNTDFVGTNKARFGPNQELTIQHTGANAIIRTDVGDLEFFVGTGGDDLALINESTTNSILAILGTDTDATAFRFQDINFDDLMVVLGDGNVGIGTSTPTVSLDVIGSVQATDTYLFSDGSTQTQGAIPDGNKGFVSTARFKTSIDVAADVGVTSNSTHSVFIRPDGLKMYVLAAVAAQILEYDLSVPHLVSSAIFLQRSNLSGGLENAPTDFYFRSDGKKLYSVGINADRLLEFDLSTAWDISTLSVVQSIVVTTQDAVPTGLYFRPDGKKMYVSGQENDTIHEYDLSISWDISTAAILQSFSIVAQDTLPTGLVFNSDGKKMYLSGDQNNSVYEYNLSTPWDITTAIFQQLIDLSSFDSQPRGIFLREDALALYFAGNSNETIYQFDLGAIFEGSVGIGTSTPDASALLDLSSTTSGFLPPRMTEDQRDAIPNPTAGLSIFDIVHGRPEYFNPLTNTWSGGRSGGTQEVFVRIQDDFGIPSAGVITLIASTLYTVVESLSMDTNVTLLMVETTHIHGISDTVITFDSTATAVISNSDDMEIEDISFIQLGTGELVDSTVGNPVIDDCEFTGGDIIFSGTGSSHIINGTTFNGGSGLLLDVTSHFVLTNCTFKDGADGEKLIEFVSGSTTDNIRLTNCTFIQDFASTAISIPDSATSIQLMTVEQSTVEGTNTGAVVFELENPDAIFQGIIEQFELNGQLGVSLRCVPDADGGNFKPDTINNNQGIAIDGDGNLILADPVANTITMFDGIGPNVLSTIAAPGPDVRGVLWLKGDLYSTDNSQNLIYRHVGFTTSVTSISGPGTAASMLTSDGTNIIVNDTNTDLVYVLDGFQFSVIFSFTTPAGATLSGLAYDGVNLIITDDVNNVVIVLDDITGEEQYRFPIAAGASDFLDIVSTNGGLVGSDFAGNRIFVYNHGITFDHSAKTWDIQNSPGLDGSTDHGGSQFFIEDTTPVSLPALVQNTWVDVAATGIFYGPFSSMEKCELFSEINGEISWTGTRKRGRVITAQFTIIRSGGGAADKFYEISVEVNGRIQKDSISIGVLPTTTDILTLSSLPITRDLISGNPVKVQIRTTTTSPAQTDVYACRLSIN